MKLVSPATLREFLRFRDMSYRELAEKVGCSKALIGHLATGTHTHTGEDIAQGIAKNLGVPVESLFLPVPSTIRPNGVRHAEADAS